MHPKVCYVLHYFISSISHPQIAPVTIYLSLPGWKARRKHFDNLYAGDPSQTGRKEVRLSLLLLLSARHARAFTYTSSGTDVRLDSNHPIEIDELYSNRVLDACKQLIHERDKLTRFTPLEKKTALFTCFVCALYYESWRDMKMPFFHFDGYYLVFF